MVHQMQILLGGIDGSHGSGLPCPHIQEDSGAAARWRITSASTSPDRPALILPPPPLLLLLASLALLLALLQAPLEALAPPPRSWLPPPPAARRRLASNRARTAALKRWGKKAWRPCDQRRAGGAAASTTALRREGRGGKGRAPEPRRQTSPPNRSLRLAGSDSLARAQRPRPPEAQTRGLTGSRSRGPGGW